MPILLITALSKLISLLIVKWNIKCTHVCTHPRDTTHADDRSA